MMNDLIKKLGEDSCNTPENQGVEFKMLECLGFMVAVIGYLAYIN